MINHVQLQQLVQTLDLIAVVHLTIFFFLQLPVFTCYFHSGIISYHFIHSLLMTYFTSNYYYKQLLDEVLICDIRNNQGRGKCYKAEVDNT